MGLAVSLLASATSAALRDAAVNVPSERLNTPLRSASMMAATCLLVICCSFVVGCHWNEWYALWVINASEIVRATKESCKRLHLHIDRWHMESPLEVPIRSKIDPLPYWPDLCRVLGGVTI